MNVRKLGFMPGIPGPPHSQAGGMGLSYLGAAGNMIAGMPTPGAGGSTTTSRSSGGGPNTGDIIGETLGFVSGSIGGLAEAGLFSSSPAQNSYSAAPGFGVGDVMNNVKF